MDASQGVVFHFSEDPAITEFVPHVARTAADSRPLVWAVGEDREPDHWFPRDCPRAMAWVLPTTTDADRRHVLGAAASRAHAVEYRWLERIAACQVYRYRLPADSFRLIEGAAPHAYISEAVVQPLGLPDPLAPLLELHERTSIQLRVMRNLWPWWDEVIKTTVGYSGIRLANANPR
jgi:hypothetical protein